MKVARLLAAMAATALAAGALALPPEEPPPEPPQLNDCSPGFWKNHQEYWAEPGQFCDDAVCVEMVMDALTAKGKGSGDTRHEMAYWLNRWADGEYGLICTD